MIDRPNGPSVLFYTLSQADETVSTPIVMIKLINPIT